MTTSRILVTGGSGFIGTHLIDSLLAKDMAVIYIDIAHPKKAEHLLSWRKCNILDLDNLENIFQEYQPTHVIHLAARTNTEGKNIADFLDNTVGTANVLTAIKKIKNISHVIVASSQHVRKPGSGLPQNDQDFNPHGLYGQSKVITEQLTHQANLNCCWTLIRPTTVWGPYHPFLVSGLWNLMGKGLYLHPKNDPVIRSYGYVKNIVWTIEKILYAPSNLVDKRVLYIGDDSIKQTEWIDSFSMSLIGRKTTKIPKEWIYFLARIGDVFVKIGIRFPMNSPRYFNLTTTNPISIDRVIKQFGAPPYSLEMGIFETVSWLKHETDVLG
ncbi:MAG: NAD(P)-dependent oxidoreductase [Chloroflexota bacterium]